MHHTTIDTVQSNTPSHNTMEQQQESSDNTITDSLIDITISASGCSSINVPVTLVYGHEGSARLVIDTSHELFTSGNYGNTVVVQLPNYFEQQRLQQMQSGTVSGAVQIHNTEDSALVERLRQKVLKQKMKIQRLKWWKRQHRRHHDNNHSSWMKDGDGAHPKQNIDPEIAEQVLAKRNEIRSLRDKMWTLRSEIRQLRRNDGGDGDHSDADCSRKRRCFRKHHRCQFSDEESGHSERGRRNSRRKRWMEAMQQLQGQQEEGELQNHQNEQPQNNENDVSQNNEQADQRSKNFFEQIASKRAELQETRERIHTLRSEIRDLNPGMRRRRGVRLAEDTEQSRLAFRAGFLRERRHQPEEEQHHRRKWKKMMQRRMMHLHLHCGHADKHRAYAHGHTMDDESALVYRMSKLRLLGLNHHHLHHHLGQNQAGNSSSSDMEDFRQRFKMRGAGKGRRRKHGMLFANRHQESKE